MLQHTGRFVSLLWVVGVMAGTWFAAPAVYAGAPSVNCPGNLFISLNPGCSSVLADYTGSASGGTATQSPPAGSVVTAPGLVAVTITVTDSMGSLPPAQCTFNITFVDDTPPVLICGPLPDINVPAGQSGALVVLTTPTASDACGGAVQVFLDDGNGPISTQGDYFATLGQNILSWGATDTAGNTSFCSQSFSVIPPVPANDDVCSALPLVADALTPFHLIGATPQAGEVTPGEGTDGSSCDSQDGWCSFETTVNNSIWFTFVAPSTGCVSIETINGQGPTDSQLAVYAVGDCNDFSTFTEVAANDDGGEGVAALIDELNGLVPGSTYYVQVDGFGGSQVVADILLTVCVPPRVTDCLLVYYDFCDGQGDIVHDTSGEVPAIDLTIADPANVTWLPGSGLSVDTPTVISSITPATRVIDACVAAEELTIEAWVQPGNDTQAGPARIVALSENGFPGGGNAVLGQEAGDYRTRARTTTTLQYGKPELSGPAVDTGAVQHVVFTRNAAGMEHLYVDGVLVDSQEKLGDMLTVWGTSYPLALANEPAPTIPGGFFRPWLGNLHLVAMYKKALSTSEVFQNYAAGFVFAPTITSQPEDVFTPPGFPATFSVVATGTKPLTYQWQSDENSILMGVTNWVDLPGETDPTLTILNTSPLSNQRRFRCVVTNSFGSAISEPARLFIEFFGEADFRFTIVPQSQQVMPGGTATVDYVLVNTGAVPLIPLSSIVEGLGLSTFISNPSCDVGPTFQGGDNGNGFFEPGETWIYSCTYNNVQANTFDSFCVSARATFDFGPFGGAGALNGGNVRRIADTVCMDVTTSGLTITSQPESVTQPVGPPATFEVVATDGTSTPLSYQWQVEEEDLFNGVGQWEDLFGETDPSLTVPGTPPNDGKRYRCLVSNAAELVVTNTVSLTLLGVFEGPDFTFEINQQQQLIAPGGTATVTYVLRNTGQIPLAPLEVFAQGVSGSLFVSDPPCDGVPVFMGGAGNSDNFLEPGEVWTFLCTYSNVQANTFQSFCVTAHATLGSLVGINNGLSITRFADAACMDVTTSGLTIKSQPQDEIGQPGDQVTFVIEAIDGTTVPLMYQWQGDESHLQNGAVAPVWVDLIGETGPTLTFTVLSFAPDRRFRCVVSNSTETVVSDTARLITELPSGEPDFKFRIIPQQQLVMAGSTTTVIYEFANTGSVSLFTLDASNGLGSPLINSSPPCDSPPIFLGGDANNSFSFDPGETWTYECTYSNVQANVFNSFCVDARASFFFNPGPMQQQVVNGASVIRFADAVCMDVTTTGLTITQQPESVTVPVGGQASFTVAATDGGSTLAYQWQMDVSNSPVVTGVVWTNINGETSPTLVLPPATFQQDGAAFRCLVSNLAETVVSNTARLFVDTPGGGPNLSFDIFPGQQTVAPGADVELIFELENKGGVPLSPDFLVESGLLSQIFATTPPCDIGPIFVGKDANLVLEPGETWTFVCTYLNVQQSFCVDSTATLAVGAFFPEFVNGGLIFESAQACVVVTTNPLTITQQPQDATVQPGQSATFMVAATGAGPIGYQWQVDANSVNVGISQWTNIFGATSSTFTTNPASPGDDGTRFRCIVSNMNEMVSSDSARLSVVPGAPPSMVFEAIPAQQTVQQGGTAAFLFALQNDGGEPLISVSVDADQCSPLFSNGDSNNNGMLDPGETWFYSCTVESVQADFCLNAMANASITPPVMANGFSLPTEFAQACVTVTPAPPVRFSDCQLVLYRFLEGGGDQVADLSGESPAIDLTIDEPSNVTWIAGGGLSVNNPTVISSLVPATRVTTECQATEELTIEAWVRADNLTQGGPARICALSQNGFPDGANAVLGQQAGEFRARARTTITDQYGKPELISAGVTTAMMQHVVFTRDSSGLETLYIDASSVATQTKLGSHSAWDDSYQLALANEPNGTIPGGFFRPWLGDLLLVAMYSKALTPGQVQQNYDAGLALPPEPPTGPNIIAGPSDSTVFAGQNASFSVVATPSMPLIITGNLEFQWEELLGSTWTEIDPLSNPSAITANLVIPNVMEIDDGRMFRCVVTDDNGSTTSDSATLTVLPAPQPAIEVMLDPVDAIVALGGDIIVDVTITNTGNVPFLSVIPEFSAGPSSGFCGFGPTTTSGISNIVPGQSITIGACFEDVSGNVSYTVDVIGITQVGPTFATANGTITVSLTPIRITDNQIVLYEFLEGQGSMVEDTSGVMPALNLTIEDPSAVSWLSGGGLAVQQATRIVSPGPATKIIDSCQDSREVTIEVLIQALDALQAGPGRIVSLSGNGFPTGGNFILGQEFDQFETRLRSLMTDQYGRPALRTPTAVFTTTQLHHIVLTRDEDGLQNLYCDGALVASQNPATAMVGGSFANWGQYRFCLANEAEPTIPGGFFRPWLGDLHLVAIFDRALDSDEVLNNYQALVTPKD